MMISESQERMVAIVAPERLAEVEEVFERWELHHAVIGEVTETGELRALWHDDEVGTIPARFLTDDCPRYVVDREPRRPNAGVPLPELRAPADILLEPPSARTRCAPAHSWTRRYDQLVQSRTVRRPGLNAAVLRLRPSCRGLAVTLDGTGRIGSLDPFTGGAAPSRGRPERRLRRWRAARVHRLPQLRQPGEARDRMGARRVDRRDGAGL